MINYENPLGNICIAPSFFSELISHAAKSCFGVVGMVPIGAYQGIKSMAKLDVPEKGVKVKLDNDELVIDVHVEIAYGVNINAVADSIVSEVKYAVETATDLKVDKVNVFIDSMAK